MEGELMVGSEYLWIGRFHESIHISKRQYTLTVSACAAAFAAPFGLSSRQ